MARRQAILCGRMDVWTYGRFSWLDILKWIQPKHANAPTLQHFLPRPHVHTSIRPYLFLLLLTFALVVPTAAQDPAPEDNELGVYEAVALARARSPRLNQVREQVPESAWGTVARVPLLAQDLDAAVDIPAHDEDAALGLQKRLPQSAEVSAAVDQDGGTLGPADPPAGLPFHENAGVAGHRSCCA